MVKITFTFDKECAAFLDRLTADELQAMTLEEIGGFRIKQIYDDDTPTDEYCATLVFPNSSKDIVIAEPVIEIAH